MEELLLTANYPELCIQTFGKKTDPSVILISGAAGQGILWLTSLCEKLAKEGYFVIRYDNRDTGKSSSYNFDTNPYDLKALAEDVISIMDQVNIDKTHIVGKSMGGYIAQMLSHYFEERILSLSLIMTTINSMSLRGARKISGLPGQNPDVVHKIAQLYQIPRTNIEERIKSLTEIWQLFNGEACNFPYDEWHQLAKESYSRAKSKNAVRNHRLAILSSPGDRRKFISSQIPITIIHGSDDPIIKVEHAYYAKEHIFNAKLFIIKNMGHILSSLFIEEIGDILLETFYKSQNHG